MGVEGGACTAAVHTFSYLMCCQMHSHTLPVRFLPALHIFFCRTIEDVTFVIDCGRVKEMQHDIDRGILRLQEQWVSQVGAPARTYCICPGVGRIACISRWGPDGLSLSASHCFYICT